MIRGYADMAIDNVPLWHERDISHSSVERVIGPDATILTHFMLVRLKGLVDGLVVYSDKMKENLNQTGGLFYAQRIMLALVESGCTREEAYAMVQRNAMVAWKERNTLLEHLTADNEITDRVSPDSLVELADPGWYVRRAEVILQRVFGVPRPG